ncbi:Monocarboxylate transporter 6 [Merluccius polli]|uniref:Monocarboxylate transporter 6 n=1 Tax=Merluccius polli TaxID=89951 RepID=A0AA47N5Q8_MERPO|nr:Monocarboxylate transporter 6 [Merluccius polli]
MTGDGAVGQRLASAARSGHHGDGGPLSRRPWTQDTRDAREGKDAMLSRNLDSEEPGTEKEQQEEEEEAAPSPDGGQTGVQGGQPKAPDGGWGWMVLLATFLVQGLTLGFPSCIGIFYTDLQTEFKASNTQTSWVPAIMIAMLHAGGPLCSVFVEHFGCRATVMAGGVLSGLSMAAGCFARTITDLYITSMVTGLGFSLSLYPSVTMIGQYFVRRRVLANALASTGTALGYSATPLAANWLHGRYGWRGSFLVLGGVLLNCCVCGAVMRPLARASSRGAGARRLPRGKRRNDEEEPLARRLVASARRHMAFDLLLSNARYRAYTVAVTWVMLGFMVPQVYLVPYATSNRVDLGGAALLMSVIGLVSVVSRPASAVLLGLPCLRGGSRLAHTLAGALIVNGLSNSVCGAWTHFRVLLLYVVVFGVSQGLMGSLIYTVLMGLVDMKDFPPALGMVSLLQGSALLVGPPLAGMLLDATGQYSYVFHACNVAVTSGGLFLLGSFCYLDRRKDGHVTRGLCQDQTVTPLSDSEDPPVSTQGGQPIGSADVNSRSQTHVSPKVHPISTAVQPQVCGGLAQSAQDMEYLQPTLASLLPHTFV